MKLFGREFKFNGFDIWHKGNFDPNTKSDTATFNSVISDINSKITTNRMNGLGMKVNYSTFSLSNPGELYMHGFDDNGLAQDINGFITLNGEQVSVIRGMINPNRVIAKCYIAWHKTLSTWHLVEFNETTGVYTFTNMGGTQTTDTQLATDYLFVGYAEMNSSENFTYATLFSSVLTSIEIQHIFDLQKRVKCTETELLNKSDIGHTHTKSDISDMPIKLSEFTNDSGFVTALNHNHDNSYTKRNAGSVSDFNSVLTQNEYSVGGSNISNAPYTGTIYGKLRVYVNDGGTHNNSSNWIWQYFDDTSGRQYFRYKVNSGNWTAWKRVDAGVFATVSHTHTKSQITDMPTKLSQFENDIGAGGGIKITTAITAPSTPSPGDFWYKEI